jgi:hypothetical protein
MRIGSAKELKVYQMAYALAMEIFRLSKFWPAELTDADGENSETDTWLDFARDCGYLTDTDHARLAAECREIGAMLGGMLTNPTSFLLKPPRPVPSDP